MRDTLAFIHTLANQKNVFDSLLTTTEFKGRREHFVDESLLTDARQAGRVTEGIQQRFNRMVLEDAGERARVILCTCSSIGECVDTANTLTEAEVLRVDRPMAVKAVQLGSRIIVAAALKSTLAPTRDLLDLAAQAQGKEIELIELHCKAAWPHFESGDIAAYHEEIAEQLKIASSAGDVIVLAQASMAGAADLCPDLSIPILSSPRIGLSAAIDAFENYPLKNQ